MRDVVTRILVSAGGTCLVGALLVFSSTATPDAAPRDLGREVLASTDGWASEGSGTTGGAAAAPEHVYVVRNRGELFAALSGGQNNDTPKIIYVDGVIDMNVDDNNQPLACEDYYRDGYTLEAYLATYDPEVWGRTTPTGPLETARIASRNAQQARIRLRIGSNTTIVGLNRRAVIRGGWFDIRGSSSVKETNIIVRNLRFEDTYDCFPAWSPTDGALGSWNAEYDSISLREAEHVWIDHNDFADVETADAEAPIYFGVLYQRHDGLVDITNASNYVTVSWNRFIDHDKVMIIGSSDSATGDRNRLKVTLHHNAFDGVGQRAPRVRFGQVHVYNNYYRIKQVPKYGYSWGVGIQSAIYAESNFFRIDGDVAPADFIDRFNGTAILALGTQVNAASANHEVDVVSAWNAENDPDLTDAVGWTPWLFLGVDPAFKVPSLVASQAGPFNW